MLTGHNGNGFKDRIDADKINADFSDAGQFAEDFFLTEMSRSSFIYFPRGCSKPRPSSISVWMLRETISRGASSIDLGGIFFHEPLILIVQEISAFAAACLGHENVCADEAGGMELDKFHIFNGNTCALYAMPMPLPVLMRALVE